MPNPTISNAYTAATNKVRLTLAGAPLAQSAIGTGDALNPDTWTITRTDTSAGFDVMTVTQISTLVYDVLTYEALAGWHIQHLISTTTLKSSASVVTPTSANFYGALSAATATAGALAASNAYVLTDIASPQIATPGSNTGGGVRVITAGGDFASDSGNTALKKLILRRLGTRRKGFFHLPNYGLDIEPKRPIKTNDLIALKKQIQDQVALEPEVVAVSATPTIDTANGILNIVLQVRTNIGETLTITTSQSTAGIQL